MLRDESFFEQRATDLNWARWLGEARARYKSFVCVHSVGEDGDVREGQQFLVPNGEIEGARPGSAGLDGACGPEETASEDGSEDNDNLSVAEMAPGVRDALDQELVWAPLTQRLSRKRSWGGGCRAGGSWGEEVASEESPLFIGREKGRKASVRVLHVAEINEVEW